MVLIDCACSDRGSGRCNRAHNRSAFRASRTAGQGSKTLPRMKEGDARVFTQMGPCGSQAVGHALDLPTRPARISSRQSRRAGCFEVIDALHPPRVVQCFGGPHVNHGHVLDQQVHEVSATAASWQYTLAPRCCDKGMASAKISNANPFSSPCSRSPSPGVLSTMKAQLVTCPDRSFILSLSACFACFVFLHLR